MEQLGPYTYQSCPGGFPLGQDTLLLGAFATLRRRGRVCDLGCGCGALPLLLLGREPTLSVTGLELDPAAAQAARDNLARNGLAGQIITGDLSQAGSPSQANHPDQIGGPGQSDCPNQIGGPSRAGGPGRAPSLLPAGAFDLVVSNPPWFAAGSGAPGGSARMELGTCLDQVCAAAGRLLRNGGRFALVHSPRRLSQVLCALSAHGIEPKRMQLVQHSPAHPPSAVLLEGVRQGRPGLEVAPTLILHPSEAI